MRETLIAEQSRNDSLWHLSDTRQNHIGTFNTLAEVKMFAIENNYRLQVFPADGSMHWFNPPNL